jgi:hypothetical protein
MVEILKLSEEEKEELTKQCIKVSKEELQNLVESLFQKNNKIALNSLLTLYYRSEYFSDVYDYFNRFVELINSENSYQRSRGIFLISINTKWDNDNKFDKIVNEFLSHIEDEKPITARQCIKSIENILPYKNNLKDIILKKLQNINYSKISDNMRNLIFNDVSYILNKIK